MVGDMLIGEYRPNIDAKGRFNFPAKLREELGESFFITRGMDNCLFVYSGEEYEALARRIQALPLTKAKGLQRFFFSGAAEVEPDKQGRILIPPNLRDHAGLTRDVTVIGAAVRAEIWDTARWAAYNESQTDEAIEASMNLLDF